MNEHEEAYDMPARDARPHEYDRRSGRRQRLRERRQARALRRGGSWVWAAILIAVGIFLLLGSLTSFSLENWWVLIILIPAAGAFANCWRIYRSSQRLSAPARASLIGGILLTMVAAIFLFNLDWTIVSPILVLLAGLGLLINMILPG
jgi:hypothetical protein